MFDIIERIVNDTDVFQKFMHKHLLKRVHNQRILLILHLAFPEEKNIYTYKFSIGVVKGKKNERFQVNILIYDDHGDLAHRAFIYLYSDLPLVKPSDLDKHLNRFIYTYPNLAADFDAFLKELKDDDSNEDEEDQPLNGIDPTRLN